MNNTSSGHGVPAYKNYKLLGLSLFGLVFMLAIGYAGYFMNGPIARVNGVEISRADYEKNVKIFQDSAAAQGADINDEALQGEIRRQSLDMLVNTALLKTAADKIGIVAAPEEVERLFASFTEQMNTNPDVKKSVTELGITDEKMRSNITERLVIDAFLESQTDIENITVTDEEITAFFNGLPQNTPSLDISEVVNENPELEIEGEMIPPTAPAPKIEMTEEMKAQIGQQLRMQKQQEIITALLEKIKSESEVEINL